jgi:thioredoxin-dependent peroxiredoxin
MLETGFQAPQFKLPDQDGNMVSLEDFKGKNLVLYFYPKDDTAGCTKEACNFRDELPRFKDLNAEVIGISADSVKRHKKFYEKYNLSFTLLSDENKETIQNYGVWKEKNNYGKKYMGIERTTFIIDGKGVIRNIFSKVKVDNHNSEVEEALKQI